MYIEYMGDDTMIMKKFLSLIISAMIGVSGGTAKQNTDVKKIDNNSTTINQTNKKFTVKKDDKKAMDKTKKDTKIDDVKKDKNYKSLEVTDKAKKLLEKTTYGMTGAVYTPVAVLESSTSSYLLLCKLEIVVPDAKPTYALVSISEKTNGNAEVTDIKNSEASVDVVEQSTTGAWSEVKDLTLNNETKKAFNTAIKNTKFKNYTPVALLSEQVVAGMNYKILAKSTQVNENLSKYVVVEVYSHLDDNAEITATYEFMSEK